MTNVKGARTAAVPAETTNENITFGAHFRLENLLRNVQKLPIEEELNMNAIVLRRCPDVIGRAGVRVAVPVLSGFYTTQIQTGFG